MTFHPRRARFGVSLFFFTNGLMFANLLPRYPELKAQFGLSNTEFGLLVAMMPLGAIVASGLPAPLIRRFGALPVALGTTVLTAAGLATVGVANHVVLVAAALLACGFADAVTDSAQNVHGLLVKDYCGRTIINSLHAMWSLGAAAGGALGAAAAGAHVPLAVHLSAAGLAGILIAGVGAVLARVPAAAPDIPAPGTSAGAPRLTRSMWLMLLPLGLICIVGVIPEEVAFDWTALYLTNTVGTSAGVAGLGLVFFVSAQTLGRLLGDPASDRWGAVAVLRVGGWLIVAGGVLVVAFPVLPVVLAGMTLTGLGCATAVPAAYAAAGRLPGLPEGAGVTMASWLLRIGFLALPPLVGWVSDATSLRAALSVLALAGLAIVLLSPRIGRSSPESV